MRFSVPAAHTARTTWRTDVREIAEALGIPVGPDEWIVLEDGDGDGLLPLTGKVDVVRWRRIRVDPEADAAKSREAKS